MHIRVYVCSKCKYDLTGLKSRGECPECGNLFDQSRNIGCRVKGKHDETSMSKLLSHARTVLIGFMALSALSCGGLLSMLRGWELRPVASGGLIAAVLLLVMVWSHMDARRDPFDQDSD
jgi:predicted amidophosphoribosyltransferase